MNTRENIHSHKHRLCPSCAVKCVCVCVPAERPVPTHISSWCEKWARRLALHEGFDCLHHPLVTSAFYNIQLIILLIVKLLIMQIQDHAPFFPSLFVNVYERRWGFRTGAKQMCAHSADGWESLPHIVFSLILSSLPSSLSQSPPHLPGSSSNLCKYTVGVKKQRRCNGGSAVGGFTLFLLLFKKHLIWHWVRFFTVKIKAMQGLRKM